MADQSHVTYLEVRLNDHTLDDNLPLVPSPSPSRDFSRPRRPLPTASLGVLDTLPIELLRDILVQLDVRTLADFRSINGRAVELVDSLPHDGHSGNPFRFVAIVRVPWLDRTASQGEVEWGFHCLGCTKSNRLPLHFRRKFSAVSFAEHLAQYGEVKDGKHCKPGLETEAGDAGVDADIDSDSDTATTL
ncbi:hypothetical protein S7711_11089 [Stachybotrys chartarum IBT 7711]|uniref:F-box domain-containing protein n=1 Tax=Stachybotrys chartarum (strain CBS 109288 / IBT 7711) TaxID=1280523 RepID=A0A084B7B9_STACB|nr:hypothetical protein S7711_11089 [Stachybotrys chartarum IBT 7711]